MKDVKEYKDVYFTQAEPTDKVFQVGRKEDSIGEFLFTFDKKTIYSFFVDYPQNLTKEQKAIFDKEYPYWAKNLCPR